MLDQENFTTDYVQCTASDKRINIKICFFVRDFSQLVDQDQTLLVQNFDKIFEDFEMKSRRQEFSSTLPLRTCSVTVIISKLNLQD